jgi:hypothetical protein
MRTSWAGSARVLSRIEVARSGIALGDAAQRLGGGGAHRLAGLTKGGGEELGGGLGDAGQIAERGGPGAAGGGIARAEHGLEDRQHLLGALAREPGQPAHGLGAHGAGAIVHRPLQDVERGRVQRRRGPHRLEADGLVGIGGRLAEQADEAILGGGADGQLAVGRIALAEEARQRPLHLVGALAQVNVGLAGGGHGLGGRHAHGVVGILEQLHERW